jgi:hypothetical protein
MRNEGEKETTFLYMSIEQICTSVARVWDITTSIHLCLRRAQRTAQRRHECRRRHGSSSGLTLRHRRTKEQCHVTLYQLVPNRWHVWTMNKHPSLFMLLRSCPPRWGSTRQTRSLAAGGRASARPRYNSIVSFHLLFNLPVPKCFLLLPNKRLGRLMAFLPSLLLLANFFFQWKRKYLCRFGQPTLPTPPTSSITWHPNGDLQWHIDRAVPPQLKEAGLAFEYTKNTFPWINDQSINNWGISIARLQGMSEHWYEVLQSVDPVRNAKQKG